MMRGPTRQCLILPFTGRRGLVQHNEEEVEGEEDIIKVTIASAQFPKTTLTEKEYKLIRKCLVRDCELLPSGKYPNILGHCMEKGTVTMYCVNQETVNWICRRIPVIKKTDGLDLIVGLKEDILQLHRILIRVPEELNSRTPDEIASRLKLTNPALPTDSWKYVADENERNRKTFLKMIYLVDYRTIQALAILEDRVYLGLERAYIYKIN